MSRLRSSSRDPVERLRASLRGRIPDDVFLLFDEYVDYGEPVVGLEQLFNDLEDRWIGIDDEAADLLIAAAVDRNVSRITPARVRALVGHAGHDDGGR